MTTPNLSGGVNEFQKPRVLRPNVVFRFESTLNTNVSFTTPIFDCVGDGWPFNEVEDGAGAIIRVPSFHFGIYVMITTTVGMKLDIFALTDGAGQVNPRSIYVPSDASNSYQFFQWRCPGRRCQFRLINTPLGTVGGTNSSAILEVTNEG